MTVEEVLTEVVPIPVPTPEVITATLAAIAAFLAISVALGFYGLRKARAYEEWLVGRRDIGPLVTGFALAATWMSGWAIFGNAGFSYAYGWSGMWIIGTVNTAGLILCCVLGYRMRRFVAMGARTVPEVLRVRFDSRVAQSVVGVAMIILLILYCVGQFKAMATVWHATTGLPWLESLTAVAILMFIYIAVGGFAGTQYALFFQGVLFTVVAWTLGIISLTMVSPDKVAAFMVGERFVTTKGVVTPFLLKDVTLPISPAYPGHDWLGITGVIFMFLFMATGFPHNIARFLGIRKVTPREFWIMVIAVIIACASPLWIGVIGLVSRALWGHVFMPMAPYHADLAAIKFAMHLGPGAAAFLAAAVFAAAVSTLAGMLIIIAANITRDLIYIWKPGISHRTMLWATRILLTLFIIPFWWTYTAPPPILAEFMAGVAVAQAGMFFTSVAMSMYWRRATKWGAIVAIVYGMLACTLHPTPAKVFYGITMHWGAWALLLIFGCILLYVVVSLVTKPMPKEKLDVIFGPKPPG